MKNQDKRQATYNSEYPICIMFDHMETGQEFGIAGNYPFYDRQLADMEVCKILATQEYTHTYRMWNSITANDRTWMRFKAHFQRRISQQGGTRENIRSGGVLQRQKHETWWDGRRFHEFCLGNGSP